MSTFVQTIASLLTAGSMLFTGAANTAAPQHDFSGNLFLVNRQYRVSRYYVPEVRRVNVIGSQSMADEAAAAFEEMAAACKQETGKQLTCVSGFRSYDKQSRIYQNKLNRVGQRREKADEYVARPGASEHQTGYAMDVGQVQKTSLTEAFRNTEGGKWIRANCHRFGFIIRYGETWESVTGYKYEPWHVRYVGKDVAQQLYDNPMPLETWLINERGRRMLQILGGENE